MGLSLRGLSRFWRRLLGRHPKAEAAALSVEADTVVTSPGAPRRLSDLLVLLRQQSERALDSPIPSESDGPLVTNGDMAPPPSYSGAFLRTSTVDPDAPPDQPQRAKPSARSSQRTDREESEAPVGRPVPFTGGRLQAKARATYLLAAHGSARRRGPAGRPRYG